MSASVLPIDLAATFRLQVLAIGVEVLGNRRCSMVGNAVFAMGVRKSFGLCFDPVEGYGYFTEVGPNCGDELNVLLPGADYGWGSTDPCGPPLAATTRP